jgi:L-ascorbate metabolism protein UlaG (beta-lactamase superfamily)
MPRCLLFAACLALAFASCSRQGEAPVSAIAANSSSAPDPASSLASAASSAAPALPLTRPGDSFATSSGELRVVPLHHATVFFAWRGKAVLVDPTSEASYDALPLADLIAITDVHPDHLAPDVLPRVARPDATVVAPPAVAARLGGTALHVVVLGNGERRTLGGVEVEAVPMYNLVRGPTAGARYHDRGRGNGYVLGFGGERVYLSGDTECTDEMRALRGIDVAFVCMNLPYTMPPAEAAACVKAFRPKVVYPYHFRGSNLDEFSRALTADKDIEVRERAWY